MLLHWSGLFFLVYHGQSLLACIPYCENPASAAPAGTHVGLTLRQRVGLTTHRWIEAKACWEKRGIGLDRLPGRWDSGVFHQLAHSALSDTDWQSMWTTTLTGSSRYSCHVRDRGPRSFTKIPPQTLAQLSHSVGHIPSVYAPWFWSKK